MRVQFLGSNQLLELTSGLPTLMNYQPVWNLVCPKFEKTESHDILHAPNILGYSMSIRCHAQSMREHRFLSVQSNCMFNRHWQWLKAVCGSCCVWGLCMGLAMPTLFYCMEHHASKLWVLIEIPKVWRQFTNALQLLFLTVLILETKTYGSDSRASLCNSTTDSIGLLCIP